jgi:small GTP-binding protein
MARVPRFKVVLLGNTGVGKTALVDRAARNVFSASHVPTVGAQFVSMEMHVDGSRCVLELWDTAGQEVFRSLVSFYTREARGCFLLFDVTSQATYSDLPRWISFLEENAPSARVIIFGNKTDLADAREVRPEVAEGFAATNQCLYWEGSAKTAEGVSDAFEKMGELLFRSPAEGGLVPLQLSDDGAKTECC